MTSSALSLPSAAQVALARAMAGRHHVIAEAAGAVSVAAALGAPAAKRNVVCIVSGGNIDSEKLGAILGGQSPF